MPRTPLAFSALLALPAFTSTTVAAYAQEIQWRHDYAAARKEAAETGRPLLLDFGTDACAWCRKFDATTFRDPRAVKLLNERFVPVKLDGNKEQRLTAALRIDGFPTLVIATPEGKVVGRHAGYVDGSQFLTLANKAPTPAPPRRQPAAGADAPPRDAKALLGSRAEVDAALAALYPGIAAALDR
ncbi:thiol:disulfide interchange protein precursor [Gemmata obscuriglobus]|uniref:Thioredoxin domain-containing protein n=1 Tax=Gemmata obscuriglobus TaxID=114 RepID=A0A2Z3H5E2_9BACT|nr:thioredoxin family protein [Gemmata obscuriglobus]AWM40101.1 hypothetical protein C1280_25920 [Gemmata obscuriglobus]QEG26731.1 thiol:disulfide interchange protein precursor [Gemmata obscuriglobus]VTS02483.1 protein disulfide-isomerase : Thioredoxin-like domain OS=Chthonomonas calidirosea (strain DSM 23976 / ICMP 18418 / T49) GN=CCALI_02379 PE=4 SV=1: Thioredoxin_7 [Gemmata obscuriglobus UQM 2246]